MKLLRFPNFSLVSLSVSQSLYGILIQYCLSTEVLTHIKNKKTSNKEAEFLTLREETVRGGINKSRGYTNVKDPGELVHPLFHPWTKWKAFSYYSLEAEPGPMPGTSQLRALLSVPQTPKLCKDFLKCRLSELTVASESRIRNGRRRCPRWSSQGLTSLALLSLG